MDMNVINSIFEAFGGKNRVTAMVGANTFVGTDEKRGGLRFKFKGSRKVNLVKVTLNESDLYDVAFYKLKKYDFVVTGDYENVFAGDLKELFENETGLYLSL